MNQDTRNLLKPIDPAKMRAARVAYWSPISRSDRSSLHGVPSKRSGRAQTVEIEEDVPPSNADIEAMIEHLDAADMREALRDLARGIALEWNTNGESAARQALSDWLATAEVLADPEALTALLAAKQSMSSVARALLGKSCGQDLGL